MTFTPDRLPDSGVLRLSQNIEGTGEYNILVEPETIIGRHEACDIIIPRSTVSRSHAKITREDNRYFVQDLGSSNGTFLNFEKIERAELRNRDRLAFGDVEFTFYLDDQSTDVTPRSNSAVHLDTDTKHNQTVFMHSRIVRDPESELEGLRDIESPAAAVKFLKAHYQLIEITRQRPSEERLLQGYLNLVNEAVGVGRGVIMLSKSGSLKGMESAAVINNETQETDQEVRISNTIIDKCYEDRVALLSRDASRDVRFSSSDSIIDFHVRSVICVPMIVRQRFLGVCYFDSSERNQIFTQSDLNFISNLTAQMTLSLDNLRMDRERLQTEQLMIIGRTMSEVSHSIKNILSFTSSAAELMDKYCEDKNAEKVFKTWGIIRPGLERMNRLSNDMLDYSRTQKRERIKVDVIEILDELAETFSESAEKHNITFIYEKPEERPSIWVHREGFEDTITNLLVNARDALEGKEDAEIILRCRTLPQSVEIAVIDNGPGISDEHLHKVFMPFFSTKSDKGNGMGLAMTRKYIDEMGGAIRVESEPNKQTIFTVTLPLQPKGNINRI